MKNRTTQLVFQSAFCSLGLLGIVASLGIFDYEFESEFYVLFTNLSNYLCIGIMIAELVQTIKKGKDDYVSVCPRLKFVGMLLIVLTFAIYNFVLVNEPGRDPASNFRVQSVLLHIILPIMYVADWFMFYERKKVKWTLPIISLSALAVYAAFIYIRAWCCKFDPDVPRLYPYFFMDISSKGSGTVVKWFALIGVIVAGTGYIFYALDKLLGGKKDGRTKDSTDRRKKKRIK